MSIVRSQKTEHFSRNSNTWKQTGFELFQVKVSVDSGGTEIRKKCFFLFFSKAYIHKFFLSIVFSSSPFLTMCHEIFEPLNCWIISVYSINLFPIYIRFSNYFLKKLIQLDVLRMYWDAMSKLLTIRRNQRLNVCFNVLANFFL